MIDTILVEGLPECNLDHYSKSLNVTIENFITNNSQVFLDAQLKKMPQAQESEDREVASTQLSSG